MIDTFKELQYDEAQPSKLLANRRLSNWTNWIKAEDRRSSKHPVHIWFSPMTKLSLYECL